MISTILASSSRICPSASFVLLLIPSSVLFASVIVLVISVCCLGGPGGSDGKESACSAGDLGSIPGPDGSPREGDRCPFQYSCLENQIWDLGSSLLSFSESPLPPPHVYCLFLFHSVVFLAFYFVLLSVMYSAVTFHLTVIVVSVLHGCSSCFCCLHLGGRDWSNGLVPASSWEGLVSAHWWGELSLVPLASSAVSRSVFIGQLWAQDE